MTLGTQLDSSSRNSSHLQVGGAGAPAIPQGSCTLGGTPRTDFCLVVFKLGSSKPRDSVEVPRGALSVGMGEHGGSKGYTKQAGSQATPPLLQTAPFIWFTYWIVI